jgi:hypothetical protein
MEKDGNGSRRPSHVQCTTEDASFTGAYQCMNNSTPNPLKTNEPKDAVGVLNSYDDLMTGESVEKPYCNLLNTIDSYEHECYASITQLHFVLFGRLRLSVGDVNCS